MVSNFVDSVRSLNAISKPNIHFIIFFRNYPLQYKCYRGPRAQGFGRNAGCSTSSVMGGTIHFGRCFNGSNNIALSNNRPVVRPRFTTRVFHGYRSGNVGAYLSADNYIVGRTIRELVSLDSCVVLSVGFAGSDSCLGRVNYSVGGPLRFLRVLGHEGGAIHVHRIVMPALGSGSRGLRGLTRVMGRGPYIGTIRLLPFGGVYGAGCSGLGVTFPFSYCSTTKSVGPLRRGLGRVVGGRAA